MSGFVLVVCTKEAECPVGGAESTSSHLIRLKMSHFQQPARRKDATEKLSSGIAVTSMHLALDLVFLGKLVNQALQDLMADQGSSAHIGSLSFRELV